MEILQIDAFAEQPFCGNPAAVCLLKSWPKDDLMQRIAAEMNLSETAFVVPEGEGYHIRWFTPMCEVELCGHATLAAAHALWEKQWTSAETIAFRCKAGALGARREGSLIVLDFPTKSASECSAPEGLMESLGLTSAVLVGRSRYDYLVVLENADQVRRLSPNFSDLAKVEARGVIVTAPGEDETDCVSRFFAPSAGVNEDPVTGSAHCCLAVYWCSRLGKTRLHAYQASARGGHMRLDLRGDRVDLAGHAVTVMRGELLLR